MQTQLTSEFLQITINHFGAELSSVKNKEGLEFMWQADKDVWPRHAPVLFPIVGKLKNNQYFLNENPYTLGQHGFARDRMFDRIENTTSSCTFQLLSDSESKKNYPFDFAFQIRFDLHKNTLNTHYTVINSSNDELFFSVGAHPGFRCPLLPNESFEDYNLLFEKDTFQLTELSDGLLGKNKHTLRLPNNCMTLSKTTFDKDALVFENSQINKISLYSTKSSHSITMNCEQWPYFGIWSKKSSSDFVCLEPWFGVADSIDSNQEFTEKRGIIKLAPKKEFRSRFSITFQ